MEGSVNSSNKALRVEKRSLGGALPVDGEGRVSRGLESLKDTRVDCGQRDRRTVLLGNAGAR